MAKNQLTRSEFFRVCKCLESEYAELKNTPGRARLAEKVSKILGFTISTFSLVSALEAIKETTGLEYTFPKSGTKSATQRYLRNLTIWVSSLYRQLGLEIPKSMTQQLSNLQYEIPAERQEEVPLATPSEPVDEEKLYQGMAKATEQSRSDKLNQPEKKS